MGKARIGVFSVGYDKYWSQFPGLLDELLKKEAEFIRKIPVEEVEVFSFGMVDSPAVAYEKVKEIVAANLDFLFCDMLTYATSGTFGVIARSVQCPIVLVALQPLKAMDYKQATTYMQLVNDDICALPEFTRASQRRQSRGSLFFRHLRLRRCAFRLLGGRCSSRAARRYVRSAC